MNIQFYCRHSKTNKSGTAPIEMAVNLSGKRTYIQTPMRLNPSIFDKKIKTNRYNEIKEYLDLLRNKANNTILLLEKNNIPLTLNNFKSYLKGINDNYTLNDCFNEYVKVNNLNLNSLNKYKLVFEDMIKVINPNENIQSIQNKHILSIQNLINNKYKNSTAAGKMAKVKSIIQFAINNNKLNHNPIAGIKIHKYKAKIEYLETDELNKLINFKSNIDRLQKVADIAVFQNATGLAYADIYNLKKEDIQKKNDIYFIHKQRQKTNVYFTAVILPFALPILQKYNWKIPTLTNQKYNAYLKEIADILNINKNLHSHLFRKTYATILINNNVNMLAVSKALGHSSTNITMSTYAHYNINSTLIDIIKPLKLNNIL